MSKEIFNKIRQKFLQEYNDDIISRYTNAIESYLLISQIHIPNKIRYMQLRSREINPLLRLDYEGHICVVRKYSRNNYMLVDGYHRISALRNGISIIKVVILTN